MTFKTYCLGILALLYAGYSRAQQIIKLSGNGNIPEVLVLPYHPGISDTALKEIGSVKVSRSSARPQDFNSQLTEAANETAREGGNVFQIGSIQDHKQSGSYKITGIAYHADNYGDVKAKALEWKKKSAGEFATIILYRPVYNSGFNDNLAMSVVINDTLKLELKGNTKYLVRVPKECSIKVATADNSLVQHLVIHEAVNYYIRAYTNFPGSGQQIKTGDVMVHLKNYQPYFEIIDEVQGNLESSLVNNIVLTKSL